MAKPIKHIDIAGQDMPIRFGYYALALMSEYTGLTLKELTGLEESMTMMHAVQLVRCGLIDGARKSSRSKMAPEDITVEYVSDAMDEDDSILERAFDVFAEQQAPQDDEKKEDSGKEKN